MLPSLKEDLKYDFRNWRVAPDENPYITEDQVQNILAEYANRTLQDYEREYMGSFDSPVIEDAPETLTYEHFTRIWERLGTGTALCTPSRGGILTNRHYIDYITQDFGIPSELLD